MGSARKFESHGDSHLRHYWDFDPEQLLVDLHSNDDSQETHSIRNSKESSLPVPSLCTGTVLPLATISRSKRRVLGLRLRNNPRVVLPGLLVLLLLHDRKD